MNLKVIYRAITILIFVILNFHYMHRIRHFIQLLQEISTLRLIGIPSVTVQVMNRLQLLPIIVLLSNPEII
jgi:hypothetical protein